MSGRHLLRCLGLAGRKAAVCRCFAGALLSLALDPPLAFPRRLLVRRSVAIATTTATATAISGY